MNWDEVRYHSSSLEHAPWNCSPGFRHTFQCNRLPAMVERSFPLNAWYAVAWRHELRKGEVLGRTVCDAKIALWRTSAGAAVAVEDACWHRLMPLSHGRLEGDSLVCRYHGLAFAVRTADAPEEVDRHLGCRRRQHEKHEQHRERQPHQHRAGGTEIVHHAESEPPFWVPPVIGPAVIESDTRARFLELRREILRRGERP